MNDDLTFDTHDSWLHARKSKTNKIKFQMIQTFKLFFSDYNVAIIIYSIHCTMLFRQPTVNVH